MTVPQMIYIAAVAVYAVLFLMFTRFFWWKHLAERDHWGRRPNLSIDRVREAAQQHHRGLPHFSILVPARNEADVIRKTVEQMARLDYPAENYEVLIVTDQKEAIEVDRTRPAAVDEVLAMLGQPPAMPVVSEHNRTGDYPEETAARINPDAQQLLLHLLADQALHEYPACSRRNAVATPAAMRDLPRPRRAALVRDLAKQVIERNGRIVAGELAATIERHAPGSVGKRLQAEAASLLAMALPVIAAYRHLAGGTEADVTETLLRETARAKHRITGEVISTLAKMIAGRLITAARDDAVHADQLHARLTRLAVEALPTTQDVLEGWITANAGKPGVVTVKHICVPYDFDGAYQGECLGESVPSTKGRALNYALSFIGPKTEVCGFYDAESRPDSRTLLYVAWRRIHAPAESRVLQGPVFQVRNLFRMGPFCKIAALYQAVAHEWYLPQIFHRLPFVGGTNLYIERLLLLRLGGYDNSILTEDLELGVRAYMQAGAWPEYLPYPSSEQTPPTVRGFFRQRLRWGTGHLQVVEKLRGDKTGNPQRRRQMLHHLFIKGQLEWTIYQMATLVPPTVLILYALGWVDPEILPIQVRYVLNVFTLGYFGFTFYIYTRYRPFMDHVARPRSRFGEVGVVAQLLVLPLAAFLFPVPYSTALVLKSLGREPKLWVKTPRTAE